MSTENFARATAAPRRLELGGETVWVHKLTPRALGVIQAFFIECLENPYEAACDAIANLPEEEARARWTKTVSDARESWPPGFHSEIGLNLLSSPHGRGVLVWAVGRKHTHGLTRERAEAIGEAMSADEFFTLFNSLVPGEVGDLRNPDGGGGDMSYVHLRAKLCEKYPGWTFDTTDDMTFEQIAQACNSGKPVEITFDEDSELQQAVARWREYYVGL